MSTSRRAEQPVKRIPRSSPVRGWAPWPKDDARHAVSSVLVAAALLAGTAVAQSTWVVNGADMPMQEFVNQVAEMTGKTIILDPRQQNAKVTVFSNTELDGDGVYELFLTVLKVHNLGAVENNGVVEVLQNTAVKQSGADSANLEDPAPSRLVTRVIPLSHVEASEIVKTIRPLMPQAAHVAAIENPNVLILADFASNISRLTSLIEQTDVVDEDEIVHRELEHAWVGTVATILEEIAPDQLGRGAKGPQAVQIVANERNNSLILKGKLEPIADALRLIDKLDVQETTTGTARVIRLNHGDAVAVAELLRQLVSVTTEEGQEISIQADESLNALVVRADPATMKELLAIVAELDVRRAQVLIEAAVVEISIDAQEDVGVEVGAVDARGTSVPIMTTTLNGVVGAMLARLDTNNEIDPAVVVGAATSPTLAALKLDRDGISFGAIVNALETDGRANLLSTPSVLTLDNQEARNVAGQKIPFRTGSFTTTTDGASNPFQTINRETVGVELRVTPHIHEDSSIRMVILLKVGNVAPTLAGQGFADVVTNERELETTVLAEDRQIILLGGLIKDDDLRTTRKVPLLGDIPVVGRAFRSTRDTKTKRYLLMFLRPTILLSGEAAELLAGERYEAIYSVEGSTDPADMNDLFETGPDD
ncbi:MAG: type II secretion system protein GspD [Gammaproteobacteria bacterium]|nr:type II secretion system protein GspD [Gammaproteobacteria bacterium]